MDGAVIFDIKSIAEKLYGRELITIPKVVTDQTSILRPNNYKAPTKQARTQKGSDIYGGKDLLGREIFLPVTIQAGGENYELPFSVLALRSRKIIVETPMVERRGTVKEFVGFEDWKISLKGFLVDALNQFPDDQLSRLNELYQRNEPVRLKCALSDLFLEEDDNVVIMDLDIPAMSGIEGVREFSMSLVSDSILTLEVE